MAYGETVSLPITDIEFAYDDPPSVQLSFAKRALYKILPFIDRTIEKKPIYKFIDGDLMPYQRTVKRSGRVIDRSIAAIIIPSLDFLDPWEGVSEKVKQKMVSEFEIPPPPVLELKNPESES
jgi:hypothetical protein